MTMSTQHRVTQPLREEHQELLPHIEALRTAAQRHEIEEAYTFLTGHLLPHAHAEDQALYPVVERLMGAPGATATMRRDHVEVSRLTAQLGALRQEATAGALSEAQAEEARRLLYGLYALVQVHFAKEEEIYLPLLDAHLSDAEARQMFAAMEAAARGE